MSLTFNEENHQYFWNGQPVPGVTSILGEWVKVTIDGNRYHVNRFSGLVIPSWKMEEASAQGKDIHAGCQIIVQQGLDWDALDPAYVPPLRQFEKFLAEVKPQILYAECPIYHPKYAYAGTIDLVAIINGVLWFIDIKTGLSASVGAQLSAYEKAYVAQEKFIGRTKRGALWLPKDGSHYKLQELSNPMDWEFFKSCLMQRSYLCAVK